MLVLLGCGGDDRGRGGGVDAATATDGGASFDAAGPDAGGADASTSVDSGSAVDAAADDGGAIDSGAVDAGAADAGDTCGGTCDPATHVCVAGDCLERCGSRVICETGADPPFDRLCTSLDNDPNHCGACGNACPDGEACVDGACSTTCPDGRVVCNRVCTDTDISPVHCGGCGNTCAPAGSALSTIRTCTDGECGYRCRTGYGDCDGDTTNGCETATDEDAAHCGGCGTVCSADRVCAEGSCVIPTRVFVTSTTYDGDLGGSGGADAICQGVADGAGLGGTWRAWVSGPSMVSARFIHSSDPYVRMDGVRIADDWDDLTDGSLDARIDVTETGGSVPDGALVWTGTLASGSQPSTGANDCLNWSVGNSTTSGRYGSTSHATSWWTWYEGFPSREQCNTNMRLYCFGR